MNLIRVSWIENGFSASRIDDARQFKRVTRQDAFRAILRDRSNVDRDRRVRHIERDPTFFIFTHNALDVDQAPMVFLAWRAQINDTRRGRGRLRQFFPLISGEHTQGDAIIIHADRARELNRAAKGRRGLFAASTHEYSSTIFIE